MREDRNRGKIRIFFATPVSQKPQNLPAQRDFQGVSSIYQVKAPAYSEGVPMPFV